MVFNLIEGFNGSSGGESRVTGLLDLLGLPYTGCPPEAQSPLSLEVEDEGVAEGNGPADGPRSPSSGRASRSPDGLAPGRRSSSPRRRTRASGLTRAASPGRPRRSSKAWPGSGSATAATVLIEAYLPGREFNVGVLELPEPEALPIAEIVYNVPEGVWPILTYAAKWSEGSPEDLASRPSCPADIEPDLADRLGSLAVEAFRATGCRDYARVDFRLDSHGSPMILEVNPQPRHRVPMPDGRGRSGPRVADYEATLGQPRPPGQGTEARSWTILTWCSATSAATIERRSPAFCKTRAPSSNRRSPSVWNWWTRASTPGPSTDYRWFVADRGGQVVGFACYGPVPLTVGTFDLYWIAVDVKARGSGVASRLDEAVTREVRELGGRWLLAETSSTPPYAPAQAFYARRGYRLLERIEDYYRSGDDRLTFGKRLDQG